MEEKERAKGGTRLDWIWIRLDFGRIRAKIAFFRSICICPSRCGKRNDLVDGVVP